MMSLRRSLLASLSNDSGWGNCDELISFQIYGRDGITSYSANACMTWEEFVNSEYNPYLPDNKTRKFFIGELWGNVVIYCWYYYDADTIDDYYIYKPSEPSVCTPQEQIRNEYLYYAD